ncbi:MAG: DUF1329 domain-containing protein [Gammaproteobacteria bacterium]|nr:DUF1329 domain-containing protein [Gammaproteobacteria bacterium]
MNNPNNRALPVALLVAMMAVATPAAAKVSSETAARLGNELTPLGATRSGNASGSIPPWQGGITEPPGDYRPGKHLPDPFADDKPLFTITAENYRDYEANLSPGQVALFQRYPASFRMPVYPSRRTASLPQRIYDKTVANATTATLTGDGNGVMHAAEGIPFPIPNNGLEAIWNHLLRYRGKTIVRSVGQAALTAEGAYIIVQLKEEVLWAYQQPGATTSNIDNILVYFIQEVVSPPRLAGQFTLVHETLNQAVKPRKAWVYNPGQRRVRRAPNVAYDNPGTASDGQRTNDDYDMYNGSPDRYDWVLVGKQELYIPYNSYPLQSDQHRFDDILGPGHINPDLTRYELHRVWVVDARLKQGTSHLYARRTFYLDEDSWHIAVVDQYDGRGEIWRVQQANLFNNYSVPLVGSAASTIYDIQNGRYLVTELVNEYEPARFDVPLERARFTPEVLRNLGRR